MFFKLKQSKINNWWVASESDKMGFINILAKEDLKGNFLVVGEYEGELATSTNKVVKIRRDGVITAQGTFYPFEEANQVYIQFLIDVNKENVIIAQWWEIIGHNKIFANIILKNGADEVFIKHCKFDFKPYKNITGVEVSGYSKELEADVVLNPFREGDYCMALQIPNSIKQKIWKGRRDSVFNIELINRIKKVKMIFENNNKSSCKNI